MKDVISKILNNIVGFRSRNNKNMAIATIYYLLILFSGLAKDNLYSFVVALVLPTIVVSFCEAIKEKTVKKALPAVVCILIAVVASPFAPPPKDDEIVVTSDAAVLSDVSSDADITNTSDSSDIKSDSQKDLLQSDGNKAVEYKSVEYKSDGEAAEVILSDGDSIQPGSDGLVAEENKKQQENAEQPGHIQPQINEQETIMTPEPPAYTSDSDLQVPAQTDSNSHTVYVGKTGTKYHRQSCHTLKGKGTGITIDEALAQGRQACKICGG